MAAASGTTYDVGSWPLTTAPQHEDLMDMVTIIDSFQTPMFSSMPKIRATDVVHSWAIDALDATATGSTNAAEGSAFVPSSMTTPVRLWNYTQIFRVDVQVSDRERVVRPAGIRDFYEHQVMKGFKDIARNIESRFWTIGVASAQSASGITASSPPRMSGFLGTFGNGAIFTSASASGVVLTADLVALAEKMFTNGAEPDSLWFAPRSKYQFFLASSGNTINARNIAAVDNRLSMNVDIFESPFGQLFAVITDRFIPLTAVASGAYYMGDRSMAKLAVLRPPQHKPMGKTGDNTQGIVLMEATLQIDHPSSWGAMTGVINT